VDFAGPLHSLLYGRTQKVKSIPQWRPCMKGTLASAISGGQWTQTRRASVPRWQIEDLRCQLCLAAPGTLEHRHECARTRPPEGWPPDPPKAELALRQIGQVRANTLRTRGLLVMRLPSPCHSADGWFKWLVAPRLDLRVTSCTHGTSMAPYMTVPTLSIGQWASASWWWLLIAAWQHTGTACPLVGARRQLRLRPGRCTLPSRSLHSHQSCALIVSASSRQLGKVLHRRLGHRGRWPAFGVLSPHHLMGTQKA
jgi:hypothetical protein